MPSYATIEDYELRSGVDVPVDQEDTVQQRLDDYSALMTVYMGPCADYVVAAYPDILTSLCCTGVQRGYAWTPGIRSESVGSTSVSYQDLSAGAVGGVYRQDTEVLDALMASCCPLWSPQASNKVGQLGVAYDRDSDTGGQVDQAWVLTRW